MTEINDREKRIKCVTGFLNIRMSQMHSYHSHKENMAHVAIIVLLALAGVVLSTTPWPPKWIPSISISSRWIAALCVTILWMPIHFYIRWQLRKRRVAAHYVASLPKVLRNWANKPPSEEDLKPYNIPFPQAPKIHTCIDYLIPWKWSGVPSDEEMQGHPTAMVTEYLETEMGGVSGEIIVSYASMVLWIVVLVRMLS